MAGNNGNVITPLKRLPGVKLTTGFFMNPSGEFAFAVDHNKSCFIRINLTTGQQSEILTEWPKTFTPKKRHSRNIFVTFGLNQFIYSLFVDDVTNLIFIVIFSVNFDDVIKLVNERNTGIRVGKNSLFEFQLDQQGLICVYSSTRIQHNQTVFQSAKYKINENGQMILPVPESQKTLADNWHRAFLLTDRYYLIPVHGASFMFKLCCVPSIGNQNSSLVSISNSLELTDLQKVHYCSAAEIINSKVFFYAYNKREHSSHFLILDMKSMKVETVKINIKDHLISNNARVRYSPQGLLYLHGCCSEKCEDKAHIYVFDMSNWK